MLKVYKECCKNCLLSADSIVSPARRREIIQGCKRNQNHFICHTAATGDSGDDENEREIHGEEIVCKTFFDTLGQYSQMVRIAERLNYIEFVDQPPGEKLPTYNEMKKNNNKNKIKHDSNRAL